MTETAPATPHKQPIAPGPMLRALRTALGLTQETVADRSGGRLQRTYVVNVEAGRNKASTDHARAGFAQAFRLTRDQLAAYLEGAVTLEGALEMARSAEGQIVSEPPAS